MSRFEGGTVICGTLRSEDLIPEFTRVLESLAPTTASRYAARWDDVYAGLEAVYFPEDLYAEATELVEYLIDALHANAPDGYCFGAHPGDGADFGFWRIDDDDF